MLFPALGSKLKQVTGCDIMAIDLREIVKKLKIPALFIVSDQDEIAGHDNVEKLYQNYGRNILFYTQKNKRSFFLFLETMLQFDPTIF